MRPADHNTPSDESQPWQYGFLSLMRGIEARSAAMPRIGQALRASQENFCLGQHPSLAFAPREIADIRYQDDTYHINLFSLGMLGPQGPLPLHYTEIVKDRVDNYRDSTLADFLNLFHHRAMSLHYRAWAKSQATAGLDRADEPFADYIWALSGHLPQHTADLPAHAYLMNAAHFIAKSPHPDALKSAIQQYFQVPAQIHTYQFHWLTLPACDQCRLGLSGTSNQLGISAVMGDSVPDVQQRFRIEIGPLPLQTYSAFLPGKSHATALTDLVGAFIGHDFLWDISLSICADTIPQARLGSHVHLGHTAWINTTSSDKPASVNGMHYSPRLYHTLSTHLS